jgi:hypothetical protein
MVGRKEIYEGKKKKGKQRKKITIRDRREKEGKEKNNVKTRK